MSFINTPIVALFQSFEDYVNKDNTPVPFSFPSFVVNEQPDTAPTQSGKQGIKQKYMEQYQQKIASSGSGTLYKYLYDPGIKFEWRLQQRISRFTYESRSQNWITIMFNTGKVDPHTNVLSRIYSSIKVVKEDKTFYETPLRRVLTPINLVFVSNNIDYLYSFLQKISFYFDRIAQYQYEQIIKYSNTEVYKYPLHAMAMNITPRDFTKLETEKRGGLTVAGYDFDLIYYDFEIPQGGYLLDSIDLQINTISSADYLNLVFV